MKRFGFFALCMVALLSPARADFLLNGSSITALEVLDPNGFEKVTLAYTAVSGDDAAKGIHPGSILFSGTMDRSNMFTGKAFAFKKGCKQAPYAFDVKGSLNSSIDLYGAVPVFADGSCKILHYSDTLADSHLSLSFTNSQ